MTIEEYKKLIAQDTLKLGQEIEEDDQKETKEDE